MEEKPLLVTGGTGFLGAWLLAELVLGNHPIRATHRSSSSFALVQHVFLLRHGEQAQALWNKITWVEADLGDVFSVEEVVKEVSAIFHVAGLVSFQKKDKKVLKERNTEDTARLVNEALVAGCPDFVYVSSIAALGRGSLPEDITEERLWKRDKVNSTYALTKYEGEMEVWRGAEEGLRVLVVNPAVIFGPTDYQQGTGKLFSQTFKGLPFLPSGATGFVGVQDCARAIIALYEGEHFGERFILNGENRSWASVFKTIGQALGVQVTSRDISAKTLSMAAWWVERWGSLTGQETPFTEETARNAGLTHRYYSDKILRTLPQFQFTPIDQVIEETARDFLALQAHTSLASKV
jgi:dihydroflavonol-4-reductase